VPPEREPRKDEIMGKEKMTKDEWIGLFRAAGISDEGMHSWHRQFESRYPAKHQAFLAWLQLPGTEIKRIRESSRS